MRDKARCSAREYDELPARDRCDIAEDLERPGLRATLRVRSIRVGPLRRYRLEYDNPVLKCARTSYLTRPELNRLREMVDASNGHFRLDVESAAI